MIGRGKHDPFPRPGDDPLLDRIAFHGPAQARAVGSLLKNDWMQALLRRTP